MDPENPKLSRLNQSPRCGARNRRGTSCQSPAMKGRARCRFHGGAEQSGGQPGNRNALKHGRYSAEADRLSTEGGSAAARLSGSARRDV
jgi:hypothetical protein